MKCEISAQSSKFVRNVGEAEKKKKLSMTLRKMEKEELARQEQLEMEKTRKKVLCKTNLERCRRQMLRGTETTLGHLHLDYGNITCTILSLGLNSFLFRVSQGAPL